MPIKTNFEEIIKKVTKAIDVLSRNINNSSREGTILRTNSLLALSAVMLQKT